MSLESSVAALIAQAGLLLDLPQTIANMATAKVSEIYNAWANRIATMSTTVFVDAVSGNDNNAGTAQAPLKTIGKALAITPPGGRCICYLTGAYTIDAPITINSRALELRADASIRHSLLFTRRAVGTSPTIRNLDSFYLIGNASLTVIGLRIVIPLLDSPWTGYTTGATQMVQVGSSGLGCQLVNISSCDIDIPSAPFGALLEGNRPLSLQLTSNTMVGAVTSLNGRISTGYADTNGVAPPVWLVTNLSTI